MRDWPYRLAYIQSTFTEQGRAVLPNQLESGLINHSIEQEAVDVGAGLTFRW